MGEIKSTLDLVMERTRHLTLSDDERKAQQLDRFKKRVSGLVQKYREGRFDVTKFKSEAAELKKEHRVDGDQVIWNALLSEIGIDTYDPDVLHLLKAYELDIEPIEKVYADYTAACRELAVLTGESAKKSLFRQHGIAGNAVIPNPEKDPDYRSRLADIHEKYTNKLERVKESRCG
ncbi:MAG: hypothetical protein R6U50_11285 [Desulfobacterales bacterium]